MNTKRESPWRGTMSDYVSENLSTGKRTSVVVEGIIKDLRSLKKKKGEIFKSALNKLNDIVKDYSEILQIQSQNNITPGYLMTYCANSALLGSDGKLIKEGRNRDGENSLVVSRKVQTAINDYNNVNNTDYSFSELSSTLSLIQNLDAYKDRSIPNNFEESLKYWSTFRIDLN